MSDLQRLMAAIEKDPVLSDEISKLDAEALVPWLEGRGYRVTLVEAKSLCAMQTLSDDELEMVAGGWTDPNDPKGNGGGG